MIKEKLEQDLVLLRKQLFWLEYSFKECSGIGINEEYTVEEFGRFETLCAWYSRSIDFLIRKFFHTLDAYESENHGTLIDVVNHAHKRGLFEDVEELRIMKDLRNTIVYEYIEEELVEVFAEVLEYSGKLIEIFLKTVEYTERRLEAGE